MNEKIDVLNGVVKKLKKDKAYQGIDYKENQIILKELTQDQMLTLFSGSIYIKSFESILYVS